MGAEWMRMQMYLQLREGSESNLLFTRCDGGGKAGGDASCETVKT